MERSYSAWRIKITFLKMIKFSSLCKLLNIAESSIRNICVALNHSRTWYHPVLWISYWKGYMNHHSSSKKPVSTTFSDPNCSGKNDINQRTMYLEPEDLSFGYSLEQKKYHEAGFDAYTTGLVFIALTSFYSEYS